MVGIVTAMLRKRWCLCSSTITRQLLKVSRIHLLPKYSKLNVLHQVCRFLKRFASIFLSFTELCYLSSWTITTCNDIHIWCIFISCFSFSLDWKLPENISDFFFFTLDSVVFCSCLSCSGHSTMQMWNECLSKKQCKYFERLMTGQWLKLERFIIHLQRRH